MMRRLRDDASVIMRAARKYMRAHAKTRARERRYAHAARLPRLCVQRRERDARYARRAAAVDYDDDVDFFYNDARAAVMLI